MTPARNVQNIVEEKNAQNIEEEFHVSWINIIGLCWGCVVTNLGCVLGLSIIVIVLNPAQIHAIFNHTT